MERNNQRTILLGMIKSLKDNKSWCGETHIQKAMYSLKTITNTPIDYDFILYKHGAFSYDLRDELTEMRADGFLSIEINPSPYGPSLAISESGQRLYDKYRENVSQYDPNIDFIATNLGAKGVTELERISTALYVCKKDNIFDIEECASRINELKRHVTIDLARSAASDAYKMLQEYEKHSC